MRYQKQCMLYKACGIYKRLRVDDCQCQWDNYPAFIRLSAPFRPQTLWVNNTMKNTSTCGFSSIDQVLTEVTSGGQLGDLIQLIQDCPQICELVRGDGNPDLSGIGVCVVL